MKSDGGERPGNAAIDTIRISMRYAKATFLGLIAQAILVGFMGPFRILVQTGVYDGALDVFRGEIGFREYIPWLVLLVVSLLLPEILNMIKWSILFPNFVLRIKIGMRRFLSERCLRLKYECFEDPEKVDVMQQVYQRSENAIRHMGAQFVPSACTSLIRVVGMSLILVQVRWWLPITVILPFMLTEFTDGKFFVSAYDLIWKNYRLQRFGTILSNYMKGREYIKELKLFRAFRWLNGEYINRLHDFNGAYEATYIRNMTVVSLMYLAYDLIRAGNVILILAVFLRGEISAGRFIALASNVVNFALWFGVAGFKLHKYIFEKYYALKGYPDEPSGSIDTIAEEPVIEIKNVSFRYPNADVRALDDVSLTIPFGRRIALVGDNGAGKSTLIKLLLGLYKPEEGSITIGGTDIREYTREARAAMFAPVFQDFARFNMTVRENLALGARAYIEDDEALRSAAAQGGATGIIEQHGIDQLLGKEFSGGTDLSGGQWQRLVLSRAFVGNKPIAVLDEPTSQLDPMAEAELYRKFAEAAHGRTAILVTHRLGSTKITDRIVAIRSGRIVEDGTHEELMERQGMYATMFEAQKQWYSGEDRSGR